MLPWHWVQRGLWLMGAAVAAWVVYHVALTAVSFRRLRQPQPPLPTAAHMPCPACGGTEHDYKSGGLWHGAPDPVTGRRPVGSLGYGICKGCGSRWAEWDNAPPYVPTDEEWERQVGHFEK